MPCVPCRICSRLFSIELFADLEAAKALGPGGGLHLQTKLGRKRVLAKLREGSLLQESHEVTP